MVKIAKILVPVDYSECSDLACRYAFKIASLSKADIKFFHAFYSPAYDLIELTGNKSTQNRLKEDVTARLIETEEKDLEDFYSRIKKFPEYKKVDPSKISSEIRPGLARDEINKIAGEYLPDIVIMGTRGYDKKENSILGSITEFAIKKLKFPVLAIPENYSFVGQENLKKIAYLTDFDETDFASIKKLMGFTSLLGLTIYCVHIGGKTGRWEMLKMEGLRDYFRNTYNEPAVECEILSGDNMLTAIDDFIKENGINILSLTTRRRNIIEKVFKPSLTKRLFYHTNIPLLVFHY